MKNNFSRILGERLVKISEVHRATGLSRATLGDIYYQRAMNIQLDTLVKICDYLQVPLSELIEYVPEEHK